LYYYEIYLDDTIDGYDGDFKLKSPTKYNHKEFAAIVTKVKRNCVDPFDLHEILNKLLAHYDFETADHEFVYCNIADLD
jgi:hypothetical protein